MKYLVPFDFTAVTENALDYALTMNKKVPGDIELLHIISSEKDRAQAETNFAEVIDGLGNDSTKVSTSIRQGDIFTDIAKEANDGNASILVMGTHGAKGLQKVLGSHAIKVITSASTPFVVTQKKSPEGEIKRIVLPVDLSKESVQIVRFASDLAKKFDAEIHVVCEGQKDEWLQKKLKNNISATKDHLKRTGVDFKVEELSPGKSFQKEVIDYGAKNRADLFAVAHFTESILPQFEKFSQDMITNKFEIPVLIVNTQLLGNIKSNYSFLTV